MAKNSELKNKHGYNQASAAGSFGMQIQAFPVQNRTRNALSFSKMNLFIKNVSFSVPSYCTGLIPFN
ncbi:TPA: hypothetical protein ACQUHP_006416, partial [Bacillus cereus]